MKVNIEFEIDVEEGDHDEVDLIKEHFNLVDRDDLDNAIYRGDIEVDRCAGLNDEISRLESLLDEAGISYE